MKNIAISFDDLPLVSFPRASSDPLFYAPRMFEKLSDILRNRQVPALGFVTPGNIDKCCKTRIPQELAEQFINLWDHSHLEIGNHSYSHFRLEEVGLPEYLNDLERADHFLDSISESYGIHRWFRHPYLRTGHSNEVRTELEAYLDRKRYRITPVTMYFTDWKFAEVYSAALEVENAALAAEVADLYLDFSEEMLLYSERCSQDIFHRQISHTLVLHANALHADHMGRLLDLLQTCHYRCIPHDEALRDPAYEESENYIGTEPLTWLERWAEAKSIDLPERPAFPERVECLYRKLC